MTNAPPPATLAAFLRQVANQLESHGDRALDLADLLAARGYPTGGPGGGRSSDTTSSTERAALVCAPEDPNGWHGDAQRWRDGEWDDIDHKLRTAARTVWVAALDLQHDLTRILAHTPICDHLRGKRMCDACPPLSVGRGQCMACDHFCEGDGRNDRLRAGLCHPCNGRWRRYRTAYPKATRSDFITDTKRQRVTT